MPTCADAMVGVDVKSELVVKVLLAYDVSTPYLHRKYNAF